MQVAADADDLVEVRERNIHSAGGLFCDAVKQRHRFAVSGPHAHGTAKSLRDEPIVARSRINDAA
jgi:hypothetical protein